MRRAVAGEKLPSVSDIARRDRDPFRILISTLLSLRTKDDVTDAAVRVAGGPNYINAHAGDGQNIDDAPLTSSFPFLAPATDGRNYVSGNTSTPHQNP